MFPGPIDACPESVEADASFLPKPEIVPEFDIGLFRNRIFPNPPQTGSVSG
jgi:hypothetical protein